MSIPPGLRAALEDQLGTPIVKLQPIGGGDINAAARVETAVGTYFLKWNPQSPAGMFTAEAQGLGVLAQTGILRVPQVIHAAEKSQNLPAHLLLEWLPLSGQKHADLVGERLGIGLAALHQQTQATHGLDHANFIGRLPQPNPLETSWITFYREQRIRFQMELARQQGYLSAERERLLTKLMDKLPDLLPDARPSLLHGDLWGGNYAALSDGTPVIYDPAVYYGHREVEIAFTELFGGFSRRFYEVYNAQYLLDPGYKERKTLYQLYPLLVHLNLFGGSYGAQVDHIARRYVG